MKKEIREEITKEFNRHQFVIIAVLVIVLTLGIGFLIFGNDNDYIYCDEVSKYVNPPRESTYEQWIKLCYSE